MNSQIHCASTDTHIIRSLFKVQRNCTLRLRLIKSWYKLIFDLICIDFYQVNVCAVSIPKYGGLPIKEYRFGSSLHWTVGKVQLTGSVVQLQPHKYICIMHTVSVRNPFWGLSRFLEPYPALS